MKRGTYVTRSTYQKVCEENKKLLIDIRILTEEGVNPIAILLKEKWRKKFAKDKAMNAIIQQACKEYLNEHPEIKTMIQNLGSPQK